MSQKKEPNIVFFDLETLPNLEETMKVFPGLSDYPGKTMKASINSIICFAYKRLGDRSARCVNAWDFEKTWKKDVNNDYYVVKRAREILLDADGIVTHNGIKFDIRVLNSRLMYHGFPPLPKIPHVDTCAIARKHMSVFSNRLNTVAEFLGCETKVEHDGWNLWVRVMNRVKRAQKLMTKYAKQDVDVLEQIFMKMRPLISNIPNYALFAGQMEGDKICPACGSANVQKNGIRASKTTLRQRYLCGDCGSASSTDKKDENIRSI